MSSGFAGDFGRRTIAPRTSEQAEQYARSWPGASSHVSFSYIFDMGISTMGQRDRPTAIDHEAVCRVVDDFYTRVQHHPTLAEPFKRVKDWPEHIARLSHFWWITLGGARYRNDQYHVLPKHMPIGITNALVDDWLALFRTTLDDHLSPEQAEHWYEYAEQLGQSIRMLAQMKTGGQAGSGHPR